MKCIIALICGITVTAIAVFLHVRKHIDKKALSLMFGLAVVGGLAIANYDALKSLKWFGVEMETARDKIRGEKESALEDIRKENRAEFMQFDLVSLEILSGLFQVEGHHVDNGILFTENLVYLTNAFGYTYFSAGVASSGIG